MPIYAPSLPPRPVLNQGLHPSLVIARFDLRRLLKQKIGMFFGFAFFVLLLVLCIRIYVHYLLNTNQSLSGLKEMASQVLSQGAEFQAWLITMSGWLTTFLWLQVAFVGGGLVARDTLFRIRPLMYAHPVRPRDYLAAKGLFAAGLPFIIQLPYLLLPWAMSILIAGSQGPVWITAPLHLIPAALVISLLMGAITLGASSMASTPRAGFGWVLGIVMGTSAVGFIISRILEEPAWNAVNPLVLSTTWPELLCGVPNPTLGWIPVVAGTLGHILLWTFIAARRTQPSEATL